MAEKTTETSTSLTNPPVGCSTFYVDSIKSIAESIGISNLQDEAAKELSEDVTFRLKIIVQDAMKFMKLGKRKKMSASDFDYSLKIKNIEVNINLSFCKNF